jgi:hypothetical protein
MMVEAIGRTGDPGRPSRVNMAQAASASPTETSRLAEPPTLNTLRRSSLGRASDLQAGALNRTLQQELNRITVETRPPRLAASLADAPFDPTNASQVNEAAQLSDVAYVRSPEAAARRAQALGYSLDRLVDGPQGFGATVMHRTGPDGRQTVVVAFAGSDSLTDWGGNLREAFGSRHPQFDQAAQLSEAVMQQYPDANYVFTGHSLGGMLSRMVAAHHTGDNPNALAQRRITAIPINAPAIDPARYGATPEAMAGNPRVRGVRNEQDHNITGLRPEASDTLVNTGLSSSLDPHSTASIRSVSMPVEQMVNQFFDQQQQP